MTVAELIAALATLDPNALLIQSKDGEGNGFSPLSDLSIGFYRPDVWRDGSLSTYSGEFRSPLTEEDRASGQYGEEDEYNAEPNDVPCVCLWPTN